MGVCKPWYKDKKTGELKQSNIWWYDFTFAGHRIKESAKTKLVTRARNSEKQRRTELELGFNGLIDDRGNRVLPIRELASSFLRDYKVRQPRSSSFAQYALGHVTRLLGHSMAVEVTDRVVLAYQTDRLREGSAPKSINEEVGFLVRLLPTSQGGAIRATLRQKKQLKLKTGKSIGKAYSPEEKAELIKAAAVAPRSKAIRFALMIALHAGMRDKEIRTLQWRRVDLTSRIITVGDSKSEAGAGRTIPMNDDLFKASLEYAEWYKSAFGLSSLDWYVFPFGSPRPKDPTRHQTTLSTAWKSVRARAEVNGRFHDNRHTFVTDLAEGGASDQEIQDLAGHVSMKMVKHYSHIRMQAKRRAVAALEAKTAEKPLNSASEDRSALLNSHPQEITQVTVHGKLSVN